MPLSRREFMSLVAGVAAVTGLPAEAVARQLAQAGDPDAIRAAAERTTLVQTVGPGVGNDLGFRQVISVAGEPHMVRDDLIAAQTGRETRRQSLLCFFHLTDQHIIDVQSPTRVEFVDRFREGSCATPFESAYRAHEAACVRTSARFLEQLRLITASPVTGAPIAASISTGDNTDNQQANELDWFLTIMDGGLVNPNSGDPARYEGVQVSGDLDYWHPDPAVQDRYKTTFGFPDAAGFLEDALAAFNAGGIGVPWYTCYGNHDGLLQGNAPPNPVFTGIAAGPAKVMSPPPGNPCVLESGELPIGAPGSLPTPVTPDPERRFLTRADYAQAHLDSGGMPAGHGLSQANVDANTAYYATDVGPLRWIVLDTVNPGGFSQGSIGDAQLAWLDAELTASDSAQKLAVLFSHHGLRSLDNPLMNPDPADPGGGDSPRHLADEVEALVQSHPSCVLWINGHTHTNDVAPRQTFWDVGTASHIDWPPQSRIVELVDNADGTLSIFTTMVDLGVDDPVVATARLLMANDPQLGFATGTGEASDRNTELIITNPFAQASPTPTAAPTSAPTTAPTTSPGSGTTSGGTGTTSGGTSTGGSTTTAMPNTGGGAGSLTVGGALLVLGAAGLRQLRRPPG